MSWHHHPYLGGVDDDGGGGGSYSSFWITHHKNNNNTRIAITRKNPHTEPMIIVNSSDLYPPILSYFNSVLSSASLTNSIESSISMVVLSVVVVGG